VNFQLAAEPDAARRAQDLVAAFAGANGVADGVGTRALEALAVAVTAATGSGDPISVAVDIDEDTVEVVVTGTGPLDPALDAIAAAADRHALRRPVAELCELWMRFDL
jgi:hypothetical protein